MQKKENKTLICLKFKVFDSNSDFSSENEIKCKNS